MHLRCRISTGLQTAFLALLLLIGLAASNTGTALANWRVAGAELKTKEEVTISGHSKFMFFEAFLPEGVLSIRCSTLTSTSSSLFAESDEGSGSLNFSNCKTSLKGKLAPNCNPINQPITASGKSKLILMKNLTYILLEPNSGSPFATIEFSKAECALPSKSTVSGKLMLECMKSDLGEGEKLCEEEAQTHFVRQALVASELKFNSTITAGIVDSFAAVKLNGANSGKNWSAII